MKVPIPSAPLRDRQQRGAVAIMFGLTLAIMIGFAGLAIDLGRFFIIKTELQNAMDACALAAASELRPGQNNVNALTRAVSHGRIFSTGGVDDPVTAPLEGNIAAIKNKANFQSTVLDVQSANISFSQTLNGTYQTIADGANYNTAAFAKCTFPMTGLPIFFMQVLNPLLTTQTVSAMAVATLAPSASNCAIPIGVCKVPGTTAATSFGLTVGQWIAPPAGTSYGTGNFGWIDFTPPAGGANELASLMTSAGQCTMGLGTAVGQSGVNASVEVAWNSRFGIYRSGAGNPQVTTAAPDITGFSYTSATWPAGASAYRGSSGATPNYQSSASGHAPYQLSPPNPDNKITQAQHTNFGRNRRVAVAPVVNCAVWNTPPGSAQPSIEGWACVLMLNPKLTGTDRYGLEFLGLSTAAGSPCAATGEPGLFGPLVRQLAQ
jgi:Flp pilus assembly protein TadG